MKRNAQSIRIVPASQAKNNFGELLKRVYENDEPQIIERAGMPVAAIISISDFQQMYPQQGKAGAQLANSAKRQQAAKEIAAFLKQMQKGGEKFSEEEVDADALEAVMELRRARRKK